MNKEKYVVIKLWYSLYSLYLFGSSNEESQIYKRDNSSILLFILPRKYDIHKRIKKHGYFSGFQILKKWKIHLKKCKFLRLPYIVTHILEFQYYL